MDSYPQLAKPISDDQELAKVLAGVNQTADEPLQFDTPPVLTTLAPPPSDNNAATLPTPTVIPGLSTTETEENPIIGYNPPGSSIPELSLAPSGSLDNLSAIKKDALSDLRPLVDKLDIAPAEKFDTYLLLIRSTDDKTLVAPAYAAAQAIPDETRKAQALLDVIKEIDYLSNPEK